jgi:hypothetical protein
MKKNWFRLNRSCKWKDQKSCQLSGQEKEEMWQTRKRNECEVGFFYQQKKTKRKENSG